LKVPSPVENDLGFKLSISRQKTSGPSPKARGAFDFENPSPVENDLG
jgi:hypothetical protein